ncbi:MAG: Bug family tripartite tricarboxylate transporter substrate binding protein [Burkholderiales bacterium]
MKRSGFRKFFVAVAAALPCATAHAQEFPTKPVRVIAASTGTSGDLLARYLAQRLAEQWGQSVIVENRSGAGAVVAAEVAAKAAPDGYTVHLGQLSSFGAAPSLYSKLGYDPLKDFAPLTLYAHVPLLIVAHPSVPAATLKEFLDYAKARPGAINYSSGGPGTAAHLTFELLNFRTGLKLVHIPYKGVGAATTAIIGGEVQLSAVPIPVALPQAKAGKVRAYAITSKNRFSGAPDVPTAAQAGLPDFEATTWFAMYAPARTPAPLLRKLQADMVGVIRAPATNAWLIAQGADPAPGTPAELTAFMQGEIRKWGDVIRTAGIKAE